MIKAMNGAQQEPHHTVGLHRLTQPHMLTREIGTAELRSAINKTINTSPGESKIDLQCDVSNRLLPSTTQGHSPGYLSQANHPRIPRTTEQPHSLKSLEDNSLYSPSQHGFRGGRSTTSAIAIAREKVALTKGQGINCTIKQGDISEVFDKVWLQGRQY